MGGFLAGTIHMFILAASFRLEDLPPWAGSALGLGMLNGHLLTSGG